MKVKINDLNDWTSYEAVKECDCKGETDRQVFNLVNEFDDTITMGKVIGEPVRFWNKDGNK